LESRDLKNKKIVLSEEHDVEIVKWVNKFGLKWNKIAVEMGILDPMKIKNRYYAHIQRKNRYDELLQ